MSKRKLLIEIDAEDKFCGDCWRKSYDRCNEFYEQDPFEHKTSVPTRLKHTPHYSYFRCQACLDAEKDAKNAC